MSANTHLLTSTLNRTLCSVVATALLSAVALSGCSSGAATGRFAAQTGRPPAQIEAVQCEGDYAGHLQGICTNQRDAIFWSFTDVLVRTDLAGRIERRVEVASHHGDLCFKDDRVYVAVNLGKFNQPAGQADSWFYVYDAESLEELARHALPQLVHGAGGMYWHDGMFIVVGGLPVGTDENYVYEYDENFDFRKRHVLPSGYTQMGIQTAAFAAGKWWFGCYGKPRVLLEADEELGLVDMYAFDCALGIEAWPDGQVLVARGTSANRRHTGRLEPMAVDELRSLKIVPPGAPAE